MTTKKFFTILWECMCDAAKEEFSSTKQQSAKPQTKVKTSDYDYLNEGFDDKVSHQANIPSYTQINHWNHRYYYPDHPNYADH